MEIELKEPLHYKKCTECRRLIYIDKRHIEIDEAGDAWLQCRCGHEVQI